MNYYYPLILAIRFAACSQIHPKLNSNRSFTGIVTDPNGALIPGATGHGDKQSDEPFARDSTNDEGVI